LPTRRTVDGAGPDVGWLQESLRLLSPDTAMVAVADNASLLPYSAVLRALGWSRAGEKVLRWSTFLAHLDAMSVAPPQPPPTLPTPLPVDRALIGAASLPDPVAAGR